MGWALVGARGLGPHRRGGGGLGGVGRKKIGEKEIRWREDRSGHVF